MIGLGKWTGDIETSMISGNAIVEITDKNGEYDFSVTVPSLKKLPNFRVYDIKENKILGFQNRNTILEIDDTEHLFNVIKGTGTNTEISWIGQGVEEE